MKTQVFKIVTILLLFLFSGIKGYSQEKTDSLASYLEIAAKNNPDVLQKFAEYQGSLQKIPQVGSLPDPEISLGVFLSPMEILSGKQVADIRLMQMFPWFGTLKNSKDEMSLMAKAKYEAFANSKNQVFYDVQKTWYELYKIREDIRISEENIQLLKAIERITLAKYKSASEGKVVSSANTEKGDGTPGQKSSSRQMQGMGGPSAENPLNPASTSSSSMEGGNMEESAGGSGLVDLYRIRIETGDIENNLALLKNQLSTATAEFNSFLNRPATSIVTLPEKLSADTLGISIDAIPDSILHHNPMLEMLKYEQESLNARKKMISGMSYPMVGIGLNYSIISKSEMSTSAMNGADMIMPMISLTLPIYRKKYRAMQEENDFMKAASEQGYRSTSNSLQTEYYKALQFYEDALRRVSLYESQGQLARNTLDILIKSFSASGTPLTDVLRTRQQVLDYEFKKVEALADYNTAIAGLKRLIVSEQAQ